MNPIVDGITQDYTGTLHVLKLDASGDGRAAFEHYRMTGHPSYILFRADGIQVWHELGLKTRGELAQQIEAVMK